MYNTILTPVDLSHRERVGPMIKTAKLLGGGDAQIILATVVEDIPAYVAAQIPADILEDSEAQAMAGLERLATEANLSAELEVRRGHAGNAILDIAEEKGVDVIVIASHKPGWEDYLIGSTAARVVRHAKCAVHVLR